MKKYIRSTSNISPQQTFGQPFTQAEIITYTGNRMAAAEPDYSKLIDVKLIRRMSRIIKLGVAAAMECLQKANINAPDAIITGTAYGCLQDTEVFLTRLVENKEELLAPTAFIQSTHNTVGAQIALMLKCHAYNNTFVHRGFSFESALLDGWLLLEEQKANTVLVGGIDEITDTSHAILTRLGLYRRGAKGGEGAAFFLLANQPSGSDYARLDGMETLYKPKTVRDVEAAIQSFLAANGIGMHDVDLVITGQNGDAKGDAIYKQLSAVVWNNTPATGFKHLCGEYPTATAFALWLAAEILKEGKVPPAVGQVTVDKPVKRILIYNHFQNIHHSLFLLTAC
jgi:3-oxoacyl-[acyl-carrier-protein] synthase II